MIYHSGLPQPMLVPITTSLKNTSHLQVSGTSNKQLQLILLQSAVHSYSRLFGDEVFVPEFSPTTTGVLKNRDDYDISRWVIRGARLLKAIDCNNGPDSQFASINDLKVAGYETEEIQTTTLEPFWSTCFAGCSVIWRLTSVRSIP